MRTLTGVVALIGLCFLIQPCNAQGATFCQQFIQGPNSTLAACIQGLDRVAEIVKQERDYELAGISMSNVDLTKFVKDLQHSVSNIEQKTGNVDPDASGIKDLYQVTDNLRYRVKDLERQVDAQATLLDAQHQKIDDLQKQIDTISAQLVKKPQTPTKKAQDRKGP